MDITPLVESDRQVIQGYAPGGFRISGRVYRAGVIVFPSRVVPWLGYAPAEVWQRDHFGALIPFAGEIDVLLFGAGQRAHFPSPGLSGFFKGHGIVVEAMDTGAACRTYNVLMAEGRNVAAAIMPLSGDV